mgnify:CR=1 FL=1
MKLLGVGNNSKTIKGDGKGYLTAILYLAPDRNHTVPGHRNTLCPYATPGCSAACLYTAGRGRMPKVQEARIRKANWFLEDTQGFLEAIRSDIEKHETYCKSRQITPVIRLNGTSDVLWESYGIPQDYPDIQFYDYTKVLPRLRRKIPSNYHPTFSRSEVTQDSTVKTVVSQGTNVAVVFNELPEKYLGIPVINGDKNDLRFTDPAGVIVGLIAKGDAKKDSSGFVVGKL